jgi:hypothetical protein
MNTPSSIAQFAQTVGKRINRSGRSKRWGFGLGGHPLNMWMWGSNPTLFWVDWNERKIRKLDSVMKTFRWDIIFRGSLPRSRRFYNQGSGLSLSHCCLKWVYLAITLPINEKVKRCMHHMDAYMGYTLCHFIRLLDIQGPAKWTVTCASDRWPTIMRMVIYCRVYWSESPISQDMKRTLYSIRGKSPIWLGWNCHYPLTRIIKDGIDTSNFNAINRLNHSLINHSITERILSASHFLEWTQTCHLVS